MKFESSAEQLMTFEEACRMVPSDIYGYIMKRLPPRVLTPNQRCILVYIIANYQNGTLGQVGAPTVVRNFYQVGSASKAEKENWATCTWDNHPGKAPLTAIRRRLEDYRNDLETDIIITLGEGSEHYSLCIQRKTIEGKWVLDALTPEISSQVASPQPLVIDRPALLSETSTGVLKIFRSFSEALITEEIKQCKVMKFSITGLDQTTEWKKSLTTALENEASVKILLSHPECALVKLRELAIGGDVPTNTRRTRETLKDLKSFKNLAIKITSEFSPISYCQLDKRIYVGLYWSQRSAGNGPIFLVDADSDIGGFLVKEFEALWDSAQKDDLIGEIPELNSLHKKFHAVFSQEVKL